MNASTKLGYFSRLPFAPRWKIFPDAFPNFLFQIARSRSLCAQAIAPAYQETIMNSIPLTVSIESASKIIGVSRTMIYALINAKRITAVKVNRRTLVTMESLRALVDSG